MISDLDSLMRLPFARPPGRRGRWARFAPERCALFFAAAGLLVGLLPGLFPRCQVLWRLPETLGLMPGQVLAEIDRGPGSFFRVNTSSFIAAVSLTQGLLVPVLLLLTAVTAAGSLAAERERGTLEPLLLTPLHHRLVIRGRFWHVATPWLRLALYALPLYFAFPLRDWLVGGPQVTLHSGCAEPWSLKWQGFLLDRLGSVPRGAEWFVEPVRAGGIDGWLVSGLRWLSDASSVLLVAGVAFFVSSRAGSVRAATWISCLAAAGALATVLSPDAWWAAVTAVQVWTHTGGVMQTNSYWLLAIALAIVRPAAGLWLAARVADTFNAVAVGEAPAAAEEPRRGARRRPTRRGASRAAGA